MILSKSKFLSLLFLASVALVAEDGKKNNSSGWNEALYQGVAGAALGVGQSVASPLKDVVQAVVNPFLHPVDTFNYLRLTLFTLNNSKALTFSKLVNSQQAINNVINNLIIDPANASNKLLRKQLINDSQVATSVDESEFVFGIHNCIDHLTNLKDVLEGSLSVYADELQKKDHSIKTALGLGAAGAGIGLYNYDSNAKRGVCVLAGVTLGFLAGKSMHSPYSSEDINQILFLANQVIKHADFMIGLLSGLKGLSDITDKKDTVNMLLKNLTSEIAHLAFIVDSSMAFDPRYKGLKILYDAAKMSDKSSSTKSAS